MYFISRWALFLCGLAVLVFSVAEAGAQQVRLKGFIIAQKPCEATRKKDRDNPGQVRLMPNRAYALRGRNATPGSHYQIIVPGAPGTEVRWIAMHCGVFSAKKVGIVAAESAGRMPPLGEKPKPVGKPDIPAGSQKIPAGIRKNSLEHVLAANWQPGFCRVQPRRRECRSMTSDRFDANNFSLHGLWPDDLDDRAIFPCYCDKGRARSCALKLGSVDRIDLSDTVRAQLQVAMPGMRSGLHLHEWTKHGTCYEKDRTGSDHGASAEEYFGESLALLEQLNRSPVRTLFAENIGTVMPARRIYQAFDQAFGAGAGDRVIVRCSKVGGKQIITELWISLGADMTPDSNLANLVLDAPPSSVSSNARRCRQGLIAGAPE